MGQPQRSSCGSSGGLTPPSTARGSAPTPCWLPAPGSAGALAGLTSAARDVVTPRSVQAGKATGTWPLPPWGPGQPARWPLGAHRHGAERGSPAAPDRQPSFQAERRAGRPRRAQQRGPGHAGSPWERRGAPLGPGSWPHGTGRHCPPGFPSAPRYPCQIITPRGGALGGAAWWWWGSGAVLPGSTPALVTPLLQVGGTERPRGSLTTHVLNTATGLPAARLALRLAQLQEPGAQWRELAQR